MAATDTKIPPYHASHSDYWQFIKDDQLKVWATDPNCIERDEVTNFLQERLTARQETRAAKRTELADNPFDPRTEVSADAMHIANKVLKHLWIIFVLLPLVLAVLWELLKYL